MESHVPHIADLLDEPIGLHQKAFPPQLADRRLTELGDLGLSLTAGDLFLPTMVLRESALRHNINLMASWCRDEGLSLAPHGKTTMAPQLFHRQLEAGAWAITASSVSQAAVMHQFGVRRVLIANEVVDRSSCKWIAETLNEDQGFELLCLVDSPAAVELLDRGLAEFGAKRALSVLVEVGVSGRRAGARGREQTDALVRALKDAECLTPAGVECFEGVVLGLDAEAISRVDRLLDQVGFVARILDEHGLFDSVEEIILSAGGSVFFDRCADLRAVAGLSKPTHVVLRSGCYITHDHGGYDQLSPWGSKRGEPTGPRLQPALELWSVVLSRPEPQLAILGYGKRDAPHDSSLPRPLRRISSDGETDLDESVEVTEMHDQHTMLRVPAGTELAVGDVVVSGISHPCTAFDKWRLIPLASDDGYVIDAVRTFF